MTALPRDLERYRSLLGLFPSELAVAIAPWLPRIAGLVGPLRAVAPDPRGEPDGYGGIARRGSYERLLLSEWLLSDALPDEFLRRAASSEHAFFDLAHRAPSRARRVGALFDTGPLFIGTPTIGVLGALLVLAERAMRAKASFAFGILQEPSSALVPEVTPASVMRILTARTAQAATAGDIETWSQRVAQEGWEEAWLVTPGDEVSKAWARSSLVIADVLEPARRALSFVAMPRGASSREIELELPSPDACVRLVRDPFRVKEPEAAAKGPVRAPSSPRSGLVFDCDRRKLLVRGEDGVLLAFPVPNSPRAGVGKVRPYAIPGRRVPLAAGFHPRTGRANWIVASDGGLELYVGSKKGSSSLEPTPIGLAAEPVRFSVAPPSRCLSPLFSCPVADGREQRFFVDGERSLIGISQGTRESGPVAQRVAIEVVATEWSYEGLLFIERAPEQSPCWQLSRIAPVKRTPFENGPSTPFSESRMRCLKRPSEAYPVEGRVMHSFTGTVHAAHFGPPLDFRPARVLGIRYEEPTVEAFVLGLLGVALTRVAELRIPSGARWAGIAVGPHDEVELVLLEDDRRAISLAGRSTSHVLCRSTEPIAEVTVNTERPELAYVTASGELVLYSLSARALLARFVPAAKIEGSKS